MKSFKHVALIITVLLSPTYSFSQGWMQYADNAKTSEEQKKADNAFESYTKSEGALEKDFLGEIRYAASCNKLALRYCDMGMYEDAETLYIKSKQICERVLGKEHHSYATLCNNLATVYVNMAQYKKAELLLLEAQCIQEKSPGKDHPDYAYTCNNLASLYNSIGQNEKAEHLYLETKGICEKLGKDHPCYATSYNNLALVYMDMGRYEEAEPLFIEAKQTQERVLGKHSRSYALACSNLALFYQNLGQYRKAEQLYLEAKQIREKILTKDHPDYANTCNNLANLYRAMGQYEKAAKLYLEAKQIREKVLGRKHPDYANTCNDLASLYGDMGYYKDAELLYLETNQILEKAVGKNHPHYAVSCNNLAYLYMRMEDYEKAEPLYLGAKQILINTAGTKHVAYASSCHNLANLYRLTHQPFLAEKEYEAAFAAKAYNVFNVFKFTNEREKTAYIRNISSEDDNAFSFYVSERIKSGHPYTLSLFHRNLILSASQALNKQLFSSGDTTISIRYNEWMQLRKYLSVLYSMPVSKGKVEITKTEEKAEQLEKELTRLSSSFAKQRQTVNWKDIKDKLEPNEVSIEFASFHLTNGKSYTDTVLYVAFVLRKDSLLPATIPLFTEKQLQDLLPAAGNRTTRSVAKRLYVLGGTGKKSNPVGNKSAYQLIWKPLEKELTGITTIYFAPSGLLHRIAFAALPVTDKEVLSDRYKLIQLATTASVADQQSSFITTADKIQLYGGISYSADIQSLKNKVRSYDHPKTIDRSFPDDVERGDGWSELPGTRNEVTAIASISNAYKPNISSRFGIEATEESLKALNGRASPGVIHIATHGFFFPDPEKDKEKQQAGIANGQVFKSSDNPLRRCGILFAGANHAWLNKRIEGIDDGILTAYEVANLYLPNTKLVVLSACETGLGDIQGNEGVYGLQRAFIIAGVQNIVMSLWKVPDAETAEFMQEFYKNLFAKQSISDAFYHAQKVMKDKYRSQPYKWAAWVLVR